MTRSTHIPASIVAVVAAAAVLIGGVGIAHAIEGEQLTPADAYNFNYVHDYAYYQAGVIGFDGESRGYYCIEQDKGSNHQAGAANPMADSINARRASVLISTYQNHLVEGDPTQAALAVIIHDFFDTSEGVGGWQECRKKLKKQHQEVFDRVEELLAEADALTPAKLTTSLAYDEGARNGTVSVSIVNIHGTPVAGIPYSLAFTGPAAFADGAKTYHGVSGDGTAVIPWMATGDGDVRVEGAATVPSVDVITSTQRLVRVGGGQAAAFDTLRFEAKQTFAPTIRTVTTPRILDAGSPVTDAVTVDVTGDDNVWPQGEALTVDGWYFDGLTTDMLGLRIERRDDDTADTVVERVAEEFGREPAATATLTFDTPGVEQTAVARTADGGEYTTPSSGGFGTWLWAARRGRQRGAMGDYLERDIVTDVIDGQETNVTRGVVDVSSRVHKHTVHVGATIADTIRVSGFPDDHGTWTGDELDGVGADERHAQVTVWWAGGDARGDDAAYRPEGDAQPYEDAHHRIIGTWDYPAVNGEFTVGGGAQDAHGDAVQITADEPGWYVFVWSFDGDDRVAAAASSYEDALERVHVTEEPDVPPQQTDTKRTETPRAPEPTGAVPAPLAKTGISAALPFTLSCIICAAAAIIAIRLRRAAMHPEDMYDNGATAV